METRHIDKILRLIISEKVNVVLSKLTPHLWGLCDYDKKTLYIRKSLCTRNKITTVIHECLHYLNIKRHENWIRKKEREIFNVLTEREYKALAKFVLKMKGEKNESKADSSQ